MENEELEKYIVMDQGIRFGKPCIKGTRIAVGDIIQWLSKGRTVSEIIADYPPLKEIHIKAALVFAARRDKETLSLPEGYVPRYAVKEAWQFKKEYLLEHSESVSDLQHRFFYDEEGNACLEYTVKLKNGYTIARPTWVGYTWGKCDGSIGNGEVKFSLTKKLDDQAQYYMDERRKDFVFSEIEKEILQIAKEYQYDFKSAYGISVKYRNPNIKKAVCSGYSYAVAERLKHHSLVAKVEIWSSSQGNHAWNVIILKHKQRKLYCDATWYQGGSIDDEGYVVEIPEQDPVNLTFDLNEFNSLGGAINKSTRKLLEVHFAWPDAKIEN